MLGYTASPSNCLHLACWTAVRLHRTGGKSPAFEACVVPPSGLDAPKISAPSVMSPCPEPPTWKKDCSHSVEFNKHQFNVTFRAGSASETASSIILLSSGSNSTASRAPRVTKDPLMRLCRFEGSTWTLTRCHGPAKEDEPGRYANAGCINGFFCHSSTFESIV